MIEIDATFRVMPGASHGLQQPGMLGWLRLRPQPGPDIARIEEAMAAYIDEPVPPLSPGEDEADSGPLLLRSTLQWALAVQRQCRIPVSTRFFLREAAQTGGDGVRKFLVAMPWVAPKAAMQSLRWVVDAVRVFAAAPPDGGDDGEQALRASFDALLDELNRAAEPGINNYHIVVAALDLGIPVRSLVKGIYTLGTGCRSRWLFSSITDRTSSIGVALASSKLTTAQVLRQAGLPAPVHRQATTVEQALECASALGYPVVVKPADLKQGMGVAADLRDAAGVREAFLAAEQLSKNILVEKHFEGYTHRLTVVHGRLIKVARRVAGGVFGDGVHSVAELVPLAQQNPLRRSREARTGVAALSLDDEALGLLAQSGRTAESIPEAGEFVRLRRRDNINAGGINVPVALDDVHPDNRLLAIRATSLLRLDFAGVDLIIGDIGRSWLETGALICEVNAQPQMGTRDTPEIYRELLTELMPEGTRIPAYLIVPACAGIDLPGALAQARARFSCNMLASADGLWKDGVRVAPAFEGGFEAAVAALASPDAISVLCVMEPQELVRKGLPVDLVDKVSIAGMQRASAEEKEWVRRAVGAIKGNVPGIAAEQGGGFA